MSDKFCLVKPKGSIPIDIAVKLSISAFAGLVVLAVVVPLLQAQRGQTLCIGPWRNAMSLVADMTGRTLC